MISFKYDLARQLRLPQQKEMLEGTKHHQTVIETSDARIEYYTEMVERLSRGRVTFYG